jgi:hypothetical protein
MHLNQIHRLAGSGNLDHMLMMGEKNRLDVIADRS